MALFNKPWYIDIDIDSEAFTQWLDIHPEVAPSFYLGKNVEESQRSIVTANGQLNCLSFSP